MAKIKLYEYSDKQLSDMIDQYFMQLDIDPTKRGGPSDLLAFIHMDMETARSITMEPSEDYKKHSRIMKTAATRLRAHMETAPAWANGNSSKAIFTLKQQLWDGQAYTDKQEVNSNSNATVKVIFGSGKEADKAFD